MICQNCFEEEAIDGENICQACKDAINETVDILFKELLESIE